jgi:hypothetical protein
MRLPDVVEIQQKEFAKDVDSTAERRYNKNKLASNVTFQAVQKYFKENAKSC